VGGFESRWLDVGARVVWTAADMGYVRARDWVLYAREDDGFSSRRQVAERRIIEVAGCDVMWRYYDGVGSNRKGNASTVVGEEKFCAPTFEKTSYSTTMRLKTKSDGEDE